MLHLSVQLSFHNRLLYKKSQINSINWDYLAFIAVRIENQIYPTSSV